MKIYSDPGQGTTVRVYLPRPTDNVRIAEETHDVSFRAGDQSEIILLVEDDEAVRELNAALLRNLEYAVIEAEDGAKPLKILETDPNIGLLLTDMGLPGGLTESSSRPPKVRSPAAGS